jgi:intracellular sulfur oxidation DsrE/DsrF family protein
MTKLFRNCTVLVAASLGLALGTSAQTLPVPDAPVARDIPGAKELPDPAMTYKVVFDISKAADKPDEVNPMLTAIARFVNTLAKNGVPADHRKIAVVFHQQGTPIVLNNEAFRARNQGHDNPNIAMIQKLAKAGIDFRVCGQAALASKIDPKTIQPEIELDLWALTTIVNLEMRGYVRVGGS